LGLGFGLLLPLSLLPLFVHAMADGRMLWQNKPKPFRSLGCQLQFGSGAYKRAFEIELSSSSTKSSHARTVNSRPFIQSNKAMRVKGGGGCGLGLGALKAGGSKDLPAFVYENDPPGPFGFPGCLIAGRAQLSARQYAPSGGWGRAPPVKYLQSNISTTDEQFTSSSGYSPW
jgi:hypothetical protein